MFDFGVLDVDMFSGVSVRSFLSMRIEKYIRGIRAPLRSLNITHNIRDIPIPRMRIFCGTLLMHEQLLSTTVQRLLTDSHVPLAPPFPFPFFKCTFFTATYAWAGCGHILYFLR